MKPRANSITANTKPLHENFRDKVYGFVFSGLFKTDITDKLKEILDDDHVHEHLHTINDKDPAIVNSLKSLLNMVTLMEDIANKKGGLLTKADFLLNLKNFKKFSEKHVSEVLELKDGIQGTTEAGLNVAKQYVESLALILKNSMASVVADTLEGITAVSAAVQQEDDVQKQFDKFITIFNEEKNAQSFAKMFEAEFDKTVQSFFKLFDSPTATHELILKDQFYNLYQLEAVTGVNTEKFRDKLCAGYLMAQDKLTTEKNLDPAKKDNLMNQLIEYSKNKSNTAQAGNTREVQALIDDFNAKTKNIDKANPPADKLKSYLINLLTLKKRFEKFPANAKANAKVGEINELIEKALNLNKLNESINELNDKIANTEYQILKKLYEKPDAMPLKEATSIINAKHKLQVLQGIKNEIESQANLGYFQKASLDTMTDTEKAFAVIADENEKKLTRYAKVSIADIDKAKATSEAENLVKKLFDETQGSKQLTDFMKKSKDLYNELTTNLNNEKINNLAAPLDKIIKKTESINKNYTFIKRAFAAGDARGKYRALTLSLALYNDVDELKKQIVQLQKNIQELQKHIQETPAAQQLVNLKKDIELLSTLNTRLNEVRENGVMHGLSKWVLPEVLNSVKDAVQKNPEVLQNNKVNSDHLKLIEMGMKFSKSIIQEPSIKELPNLLKQGMEIYQHMHKAGLLKKSNDLQIVLANPIEMLIEQAQEKMKNSPAMTNLQPMIAEFEKLRNDAMKELFTHKKVGDKAPEVDTPEEGRRSSVRWH